MTKLINVPFLQECLATHPSPSLSNFLVRGFSEGLHMGFVSLPSESFECPNLRSSSLDMEAVDLLLQSKLEKGFIIGPFTTPPFRVWRVNPLGLVRGKFSNKLRLIYDSAA